MRLTLLASVSFCGSLVLIPPLAHAQTPPAAPPPAAPPLAATTTAPDCTVNPDPYKNFACLDAYLGTGVLERFINYYRLEWGESGPPTDPNAPPGRRSNWDTAPQTNPRCRSRTGPMVALRCL